MKLLWTTFYIVTSILLGYFFIKEKKVIDTVKRYEDKILKKISLDSSKKELIIGNILTIVALIVSIIFFMIVDRKPDPLIFIKNIGIYTVFIVNLSLYIFKREQEFIFILNFLMIILGKLMFNILDVKFYIYLAINIIISLALIYLYRKSTNKIITMGTLKAEINQGENKIKYDELNQEVVETEKRRRSSIGRAISRINSTILAVVIVGLIQGFYIGNYIIPSGSMEPTILVKDRVFANMIKYRFTNPKVGDIIAFKEPIKNQVMYTKRIVGVSGTTLQIISGRINENDKVSGILNRPYEPSGLLYTNKIYIPKKGDKVKLDKIVMIGKLVGETFNGEIISRAAYEAYNNGEYYEDLTGEDFLTRIKTKENFKNIIGNDNEYVEDDPKKNVYYTFTLKVEGRDELVLPIMDFKRDDKLFLRLLNGETITLDQNYYMAMGDNTENSYDSRYFGYIGEKRIKGELLFRWWPLNRIGRL